VTAWLVENTVLVANVGDAKAVLARVADKVRRVAALHGLFVVLCMLLFNWSTMLVQDTSSVKAGQLRALVLTKDHLAIHASERARITKAGGHVTNDGRLNGRIQVSRSFGDVGFKQVCGVRAGLCMCVVLCSTVYLVIQPQVAAARTRSLTHAGGRQLCAGCDCL
jgi:integrin-linked kinase-associated serine/threonine phosphatase 2C